MRGTKKPGQSGAAAEPCTIGHGTHSNYLVSKAFGLKFQVKATDVRWKRGDTRASWWMQARVTDADGQVHEYEETSPVYTVDVHDPSQMGEASLVPLYLLWMDLFLHGMRLAVPQLPWDNWTDR